MANSRTDTRKLVTLAIFTALIIVLQLISNVAKIGPVSITLSLVPIVVGAALYGAGAGAYLGGVFGAVVLICSMAALDPGGAIMWNVNPLMTAVICLVKGIGAGGAAAGVYRLIEKKNQTLAAICAGITAPVVNTGLFVMGALLFFRNTLTGWSDGWAATNNRESDLLLYIILGLAGVNFLLEVTINLVLAPIIVRIINARKK